MSYNKSLFEGVPKKNANKSRFNLSHEYKAQIQPGRLIPVLTMECLPGDEWNIDTEFMFRFNPLYYPVMHKMTMRADYFYIPNRILWNEDSVDNEGWKKWIAETTEEEHPHFTATIPYETGFYQDQVLAFMGIPLIDTTTAGSSPQILGLNAMPLSAYLKIWDEYYRNPQLEAERWFNLQAGDNTTDFVTAFALHTSSNKLYCLRSKWEKDYLTSAIPTPQIGEAVLIPSLGIDEDGDYLPQKIYELDGDPSTGPIGIGPDAAGDLARNDGGGKVVLETQATIKQLRLAEVLQGYYERIMKVGQRYRDFIEGLWGHDPNPMFVDVPVLLGSKFGRVQISDVMTQAYTSLSDQSRQTGDYTGQANLYENGGQSMKYTSLEHGWVMCILQVNANTSYGQGIERFWRREVQTDYPLDMFSSIGDQEILKEEVLYNPVTAQAAKNQETFGYIPRFSEMRYKNNIHIGALNYTAGLSMHAGRYWEATHFADPAYNDIEINTEFVEITEGYGGTDGGLRLTDIFRSLPLSSGVSAEANIFIHLFHSVYVNRPLPVYSTPKL